MAFENFFIRELGFHIYLLHKNKNKTLNLILTYLLITYFLKKCYLLQDGRATQA